MIPCPAPYHTASSDDVRLRVAGKFLRRGQSKVLLKGVSYGPFQPNSRNEPFPEDSRLVTDLTHIHALGFNTIRLYHPPSEALLREATRLGLNLIVGIAWGDHVDFLRDRAQRNKIVETIQTETLRLRDHPNVVAFLIGNEIEKTLVRWMGPRSVQHFLETLISCGKACAPNQLFSYATYPSTEYLIPRNADFLAVNVYLEEPESLAAYLLRLQNLAGNKPLIITEFGLDVATHGETKQAAARQWFQKACHAAAVAGTVWFSYTDEWFRGGAMVTGWQFGIVDAARRQRASAECSDLESVPETPSPGLRFSVIVCTYNGSATLKACLESLQQLRYPDYEVIVIDDGSTHDIRSIAQAFPGVRYERQEHAGLSVARNLGAALATGEILAYTDDDCIADEDWLTYIAAGFDDPRWAACGGPNIPPPPRNATEAIVAAAPGAPAHVLLSDIEAEHLPGCNLAIRKSALEAIQGFRAVYRVAGDDVDICWRLRETGGQLRFVPGAMVWHHRRYSVRGYLRQQCGYGHAEALLMKEHPQRFGPIGGARWRGAIYGDVTSSADPAEGSIFHGPLGQGLFQGIYQHSLRCPLDWLSGVLWVALFSVALLLGFPKVAALMFGFSLIAAVCRLRHLPSPPYALSFADRLRLLGLCWLQPMLREGSRLKGMILMHARPSWHPTMSEVFEPAKPRKWSFPLGEWSFWSEHGVGREAFLERLRQVIRGHNFTLKEDDGWRRIDLEAPNNLWFSTAILTVTEYHSRGRCLTRVRGLLRLRPVLVFLFGGFFVYSVLEHCRSDSVHALTIGVLDCLFITGLIFIFRSQLRHWVHEAAAKSELTPLTEQAPRKQEAPHEEG